MFNMFINLHIDEICSIEKQVSYINDQDHENNCSHSTEMHVANYALDAKDGLIDYYMYDNEFDVNNEALKMELSLTIEKHMS